ncbi:MAG: thiosulfate sulfurtransferase GlpE [Nitrospinae bacterium]|nr:thiosulfate sulfurtransferase GlpE [Nitrospinota bacterium]
MSNWQEISVQQTKEKIEAGEAEILDIRDPDSYEATHIPGAIHLGDKNAREVIGSLDKEKPLIVYCYHGISSQGAAAYFAQQGFKEVYSLAGGFESWYCAYPAEP